MKINEIYEGKNPLFKINKFLDDKKKREEYARKLQQQRDAEDKEKVDEKGLPKNYNPDSETYRGTKNRIPNSKSVSKADITVRGKQVDFPDGSYDATQVSDVEKADLEQQVKELIDILGKREAMVLKAYFGFEPFEKSYTLGQIAKAMNLSDSRTHQILKYAMLKLRNPRVSRKLRSYIGDSVTEDLGSIPPLTDLIIMAVVGQTTVAALKAAFKAGKYALKLKKLADKAGVKLNSAVMGEQGVAESNPFTDARMNAIKAGKKEFTVKGKKYRVTGDISDEEEAIANENINEASLKVGSRGEDVAALQRALGIPADGIFGPATLAAVKAAQERLGVAADGIVGPKTMAAMQAAQQAERMPTATRVEPLSPIKTTYLNPDNTDSRVPVRDLSNPDRATDELIHRADTAIKQAAADEWWGKADRNDMSPDRRSFIDNDDYNNWRMAQIKTAPVSDDPDRQFYQSTARNLGANDDMSFGQAFRAARSAAGGGDGQFTWRGKQYQTNLANEPYIPASRQRVVNSEAVNRSGVAEAAYSYVDILSDDLPDGIHYDFNNLPKVNWSQYSKEDIEKFVEYLYNLDYDDYEGHYGSMYIKAIRWIEKNILKLSEGILDDIKTRHRIKSRIKDFELDREDNDKFGLQNPRQDRAERRLRKKLGKQIPPRLSPDQTRNAEYQEAVNRDEYAATLAVKQQDRFFAAALAALDRLVKSDPRGQSVDGYAFDIARAFNGINGKELAAAYANK